jgi:hypothetical protein
MGLVSLDSARGCGRKSNSGSDMAYKRPFAEAHVFDIYLDGLSNNNVIIDEAFDVSDPVQRWRLYCEKCGATLTYSDVSVVEMAEKYRYEAVVDAKVSAFCKAHCHQVKKPLPIQIVKLAPIPIIKTTPAPEYPTPLPLKRSGRKVR